ncbi:hypothetical protein Cgig2_004680 [Carnegiea gigantea]|uniref:Uncharacterized protein n=1 Tax=Carnegiea gigantea TaxID=171969 RepID=A0A9Q1JTB3_9CARY|nr:hypothetical protein Cgig2_004680 [Carnegiea gigantea]
MVGPSRRMSTTQTSDGSGSSLSDFNNSTKYYCNCAYEVFMYETDDNYGRRYLVYPLENASACQYLAVVDPDYSKQARDVINQLTKELREMEFDDPLTFNASSPMKGPHMGPPTNNICGNVIPMRFRIRAEKAIIIRKLQAFVNNMKTTLLEKGHAVRASEETNTKLTFAVSCVERCSRA